MPRQRGLIKIQGTLEELNFYFKDGKYLVRRKTGVDAERIARDPVFARTRENASDFAEVMRTASLLFRALGVGGRPSPDPRMHLRLKQVLFRARDLQEDQVPGLRSAAAALATPQGVALLRGFSFLPGEGPEALLGVRIRTEPRSGEMRFEGLEPSWLRDVPQGATHLSLTAQRVDIDLAGGEYLRSPVVTDHLPLNADAGPWTLSTGEPRLPGALSLFTLWVGFSEPHPVTGAPHPLQAKKAGGVVGAHAPGSWNDLLQ